MYAVIETGGRQYKVQEGQFIEVEKLPQAVGEKVELDRVLLVAEGPPKELDRFLAAVRLAMDRYIEDIEQTVRPATAQFRDFGVRH